VLGTFAIYYREPRTPSPYERNVVEQITHLASIALERELSEAALRQAQADLAHVSRVTTMGELTVSLAQEVNQPIAAAVTNANTCMLWLDGDTPNIEEARAAAMRIVQDGTRASDIISRIRLLFKKGTPERTPVDVNELIREMIVLLRSEAARYGISVRTELAADLAAVTGDRVQLQQVLLNLIVNGIDAMKEIDRRRDLTISSRAGGDHVQLSVSDTGVGMPAQQPDQIFTPFFTTKAHGTGMGLSISRSIVESHGGRLWAEGNASHGATFHVTLPVTIDGE
jgi:C4-dicarboxylate-specific signal transduction histidine kinase